MKLKIAIIGSSGYIGKYLLKKIKNEKTIEEVITIDKTSGSK